MEQEWIKIETIVNLVYTSLGARARFAVNLDFYL